MNASAPWRSLPPVGEPIHLRRAAVAPAEWSAPRHAVYLQSGTAALALLLVALARRAKAAGSVASEVLLPAYGCPDIVSAVAHAGLRARLVDLGADSPFPSPDHWRAAIGANTLALVTVGFQGMRDPFTASAAYAAGLGSGAFIEDDCQVHPMAAVRIPGHSLALSFGRGKPVSLMHGGAALASEELAPWLPSPASAAGQWREFARLGITTRLYNVLRAPWAYGWVTRLPGLGVGETRYKQLHAIEAMNARAQACLDPRMGWQDPRRRQLQLLLREKLAAIPRNVLAADLWRECGDEQDWLLRYPLLLGTRALRDTANTRLNAAGLGASTMYGRPLNSFDGIASALAGTQAVPEATAFANRLLTLPLHEDVRADDVERVCATLRALETP